jgi:hypothetical protein
MNDNDVAALLALSGRLTQLLTEAVRAGSALPPELKPLVLQLLPADLQRAAKYRVPGTIAESDTPQRRLQEFTRPTPGVMREGDVGRESVPESAEQAFERGFGLVRGKMPNVFRGPLDDEEPRLPPPARRWNT